MKCPKCGSKYITVVNRPIQLKEKTDSKTLEVITLLGVFGLFAGIVLFWSARSQFYGDALKEAGSYIVGIFLLKWSSISLLACGIINALRPHKWDNKLVGVCMDCGHAEVLKAFKEIAEENTATVPSEENKQE